MGAGLQRARAAAKATKQKRAPKKSDYQERIIPNDNSRHAVASLPPKFVLEITSAQVHANRGWAPDNHGLIDNRVAECPSCGALGMNTCWGFWLFTCGAEVMPDGEISKPCKTEG